MDAMKKANQELRTEMGAQSPLLKEILDSQDAYMKKVREWELKCQIIFI